MRELTVLEAAALVPHDTYGTPPRPAGNRHFCGGYISALVGTGQVSQAVGEDLFVDFYDRWSGSGPAKLSDAEIQAWRPAMPDREAA